MENNFRKHLVSKLKKIHLEDSSLNEDGQEHELWLTLVSQIEQAPGMADAPPFEQHEQSLILLLDELKATEETLRRTMIQSTCCFEKKLCVLREARMKTEVIIDMIWISQSIWDDFNSD